MNITTDDFYEYGKWARDCHDGLEVKPQWFELIMKDNVEQPSKNGYNMTDEKADRIDKAVCALCNYDVELSKIFVDRYVEGMTFAMLKEKYNINNVKIGERLNKAGGFVTGVAISYC